RASMSLYEYHDLGVGLVELMIALALSVMLIGGAASLLSGMRPAYRQATELSRLQENGRFALDLITRDFRLADFWGCSSGSAPAFELVNDLAGASAGAGTDYHVPVKATDGNHGSPGAPGAWPQPDSITL